MEEWWEGGGLGQFIGFWEVGDERAKNGEVRKETGDDDSYARKRSRGTGLEL